MALAVSEASKATVPNLKESCHPQLQHAGRTAVHAVLLIDSAHLSLPDHCFQILFDSPPKKYASPVSGCLADASTYAGLRYPSFPQHSLYRRFVSGHLVLLPT